MQRIWVLLCLLASLSHAVFAQEGESASGEALDDLQRRIVEIEQGPDPAGAAQTEALDLLRRAVERLQAAGELDRLSDDLLRNGAEAPDQIASIRTELDQSADTSDPPVPAGASLDDLERFEAQANAELSSAVSQLEQRDDEIRALTQREPEISSEISRVASEERDVEDALVGVEGATDLVGRARLDWIRARRTALQAESRKLEAERATYQVRRDLLTSQRDRDQRRADRAEHVAGVWRERVTGQRQSEAEAAEAETEEQVTSASNLFPELGDYARRNNQLAEDRTALAGSITATVATQQTHQGELNTWRRRFEQIRHRVPIVGLTREMGRELRDQYVGLPRVNEIRGHIGLLQGDLSSAQFERFRVADELAALGGGGRQIDQLVQQVLEANPDADEAEAIRVATELVSVRRTLLEEIEDDYETWIDHMHVLEQIDADRIAVAEAARTYIGERILWVRSVDGLPNLVNAAEALRWLGDGEAWSAAGGWARRELSRDPAPTVLWALVLIGLVAVRRHANERVREATELVRSYRTDRFRLTLSTMMYTVALAAPLPILLHCTGLFLAGAPQETYGVAYATGRGLLAVSLPLFVLEFARHCVRPKCLCEGHFRWPIVGMIARQLRWFTPLFITATFVSQVMDKAQQSFGDSLGRLGFIVAMVALSIFDLRVFRPSGRLLSEYFSRVRGSLIERTRYLWYTAAVGLPLALVTSALFGYYYTALELRSHLRASILLGLVMILVNALLLRWLFLARRRLAVNQARKRAQARADARAAEEGPEAERLVAAIDEDQVDIPAVDQQTRQLFRSVITFASLAGLYLIWASSVPALRVLDRVQLWPELTVRPVTELLAERDVQPVSVATPSAPAQSAGAEPLTPTGIPNLPVGGTQASEPDSVFTLADVALAILVLVLMGIAAKNVPGLLGVAMSRLPLDSGSRYALSTLSRYIILIVGISVGSAALGIGWSKVQWLAAALTFGLAFGLQEIFANFVSGVIILIERPIRVGDVVTVAGIEGRVSKLRMRATTILDLDRRELLVPNREFITGSLINWTLSDAISRLVVSVGIAYGSDTKLARELLLKAAKDSPLVVDEPPPHAYFLAFGASSLDFELRIYISHRERWAEAFDDVHSRIDDEFRQAGIEISFPQRDLHIRSAPGLEDVAARDVGAARSLPGPEHG